MQSRGSGHIVNVLSTCALFSNENMGIYTTMKAGLRDLTKVLTKEVRASGVKVTAVYPGGVDTEFRTNARPDYLRPESAAKLIVDALFVPEDAVIHDLVFRPMSESNFWAFRLVRETEEPQRALRKDRGRREKHDCASLFSVSSCFSVPSVVSLFLEHT
jgi:short-subunit dehydrogenase